MAIPDFQSIMLPLLAFAGDQKEHSLRQTIEALAEQFRLSHQERTELLPSGRQATFHNRVGWARTYLTKAGLLEATRRGHFRITSRGLEVLGQNPAAINIASLRQFPEFLAFQRTAREEAVEPSGEPPSTTQTPEEQMDAAYQEIREALARDLLQAIKGQSPAFFERIVLDLLVKMGYGGTRKDAGQALGRSGDAGIDGIIKEDRLGLDVVYIQAKRWEGTVGRPDIQRFAGALAGQRARRGIFITTSDFSQAARDYVSHIDTKIVLIDGATLAELMIDHDVGVTTVASYDLKRIDADYFTEE
jgi:restriction system protein